MKNRAVFVLMFLSLVIASVASASVVVSADDGAVNRIDTAKLTRMTDIAIHRAAPRANVTVSIAIGAPEVWMSALPMLEGTPLPITSIPPQDRFCPTCRGAGVASETVRLTYTISDANGAVLESVPMVLNVGHASTLEAQLTMLRRTSDFIASRVAATTAK